jgi:hypothetical protein
VQGKVFIDASGDADLASWCDLPCQPSDQALLSPVTACFRLAGGDPERAERFRVEQPEAYQRIIRSIPQINLPLHGWLPTNRPGEAWFDVIFLGGINTLDPLDLTRAELQTRRMVEVAVEVYRKLPGFEDAYLVDVAPMLGVREGRRIQGKHILSRETVDHQVPDSIARMRDHLGPPGSSFAFPFRCLLSEEVKNVLFAGRNASVAPDMFDLTREIASCFSIGQGAGIAAALAAKENNGDLHQLSIETLQEHLRRAGAVI